MIRPRDGHGMPLHDPRLPVSPCADLRQTFDSFRISVALPSFPDAANERFIESELLLRRDGSDEPLVRLGRHAGPDPVHDAADVCRDLGPYLTLDRPPDRDGPDARTVRAVPDIPGDSFKVLGHLASAVHGAIGYARRAAEGVQRPADTIRPGTGTCRDFTPACI